MIKLHRTEVQILLIQESLRRKGYENSIKRMGMPILNFNPAQIEHCLKYAIESLNKSNSKKNKFLI